MANHWKKLSDKLGSSAEGPNDADWAAMERMIADQPALQAKKSSGLLLKAALISFGSLILIATLWFFNTDHSANSPAPVSLQNNIATPNPKLNNASIEDQVSKESLTNSTEQKSKAENIEKQTPPSATLARNPQQSQRSQPAAKQKEEYFNNLKSSDENTVVAKTKASVRNQRNTKNASAEEQNSPGYIKRSTKAESETSFQEALAEDSDGSLIPKSPSKAETLAQAPGAAAEENVENKNAPNLEDDPLALAQVEGFGTVEDSTKSPTNEPEPTINSSDSPAEIMLEEPGKVASPSASEEDFINPATGFKLQSLKLALGGASNFKNPMGYGFQAALDFQWNRNNWFFQSGLSLSQDYQTLEYKLIENQLLIDSSYALDVSSRQVPVITRIWVIDSINAGHYEIDTTFQTLIDTNIVLNLDSNEYQVSYPKTKQIRFQYAELPILYGYQKQLGAWNISLAAGISVQQALAVKDENYSRSESFSLAFLVQPSISYRISQQWSVFTRLRLQEQVVENRLFQTNQSPYSCQLGVSYHW